VSGGVFITICPMQNNMHYKLGKKQEHKFFVLSLLDGLQQTKPRTIGTN